MDNTSNNAILEKHLEFIQSTITRMGQNSFQAKAWCIALVSGLLVFALSKENAERTDIALGMSIGITMLFCLLDGYYLYLERGYRKLYRIAAHLEDAPLAKYEMSLPREYRGFKHYIKAIVSWSIGCFYLTTVILLFVLRLFLQK